MSVEKLSRNFEIYYKYKNGATYSGLAIEYGISIPRIRSIIQRARTIVNKQKPDIPEIDEACRVFEADKTTRGRILLVFKSKRLDEHGKWKKLSRLELLKFKNIGEKSADIIEYAQKIAK